MSRFLRTLYIKDPEELRPFREFVLGPLNPPPFGSIIVGGNPLDPTWVECYAKPVPEYNDQPIAFFESIDGDIVRTTGPYPPF